MEKEDIYYRIVCWIDYSYQRIVDKADVEVQQVSNIKYIEFE